MTIKPGLFITCTMLFLLIFSVATSTAVRVEECKCDYITIHVAEDVACKLTMFVSTGGAFESQVLGPGSVVKFKCEGEASVYILDCFKNLINLTEGNPCMENICISKTCAVTACRGRDENGCIYFKIAAGNPGSCGNCPN